MKSLLQISHLYKSFADRELISDATASINEGDKIGFIGRNGAGKSTLLKIIIGAEESDRGEIVRSGDLRLAYLEQHDTWHPGEEVLAYLERYSGEPEWTVARIAGRFGLRQHHLHVPIESLSGGYRMRVKLTAMLLQQPNLLLLDEPTNFLDLQTILLLERFLNDFNGAVLLVSHDREFLKRTTESTLEMDQGRLAYFPGPLEEFFAFQAERRQQAERFNDSVEAKQKQLQNFITRFGAKNTKATQAKSKEKMLARLEKIEIGHPISSLRIRIPPPVNRAAVPLRLKELTIGYGKTAIASGIEFQVEWGARLALLGGNGEGKTTLVRTISGQLEPLVGQIEWKGDVRCGYFAQHVYAALDGSDSIYDYLRRVANESINRQQILDLAGSFLFRGDAVEKPIAVLSGGERARLLLAGLLLGRFDVLLLDEPTNHLDFETVEALGAALRNFAGVILFVSHDRTFVNLVATGVLELADGKLSHFPGSYEEYVYHLQQRIDSEESESESPKGARRDANRSSNSGASDSDSPNSHQRRKQLRSEVKRLATQHRKLESRLSSLEAERATLLERIESDPSSCDATASARLAELTTSLESDEARWLEMAAEIERLQKEEAGLSSPASS